MEKDICIQYGCSKKIPEKKESLDRYQGLQFGLLTVLHSYKNEKGYLKCICKCNCGEIKEVFMSNLRGKNTRSCGCLANKIKKSVKS